MSYPRVSQGDASPPLISSERNSKSTCRTPSIDCATPGDLLCSANNHQRCSRLGGSAPDRIPGLRSPPRQSRHSRADVRFGWSASNGECRYLCTLHLFCRHTSPHVPCSLSMSSLYFCSRFDVTLSHICMSLKVLCGEGWNICF